MSHIDYLRLEMEQLSKQLAEFLLRESALNLHAANSEHIFF
ncbi:hypothetical protein JCM19239_4324 [Vibrio variabilis]|uniref:Uncharacterized protein n=1 Tax=Vibrio variabilis TaxID=990271 RepID=A0ABQ0JE21_9VIBR|nr:hypothetical protein JCM19239_4324 [Vibrio variabilis]